MTMLTETDIKGLNPSQLAIYLDVTGFSAPSGNTSHPGNGIKPDVANLTRLMQRHLCVLPFANTFVHYSKHVPAVDPDSLFQRIVIERQPCYCFGQNILFMSVLQSIGYSVYAGLARSNFAPPTSAGYIPGPITHIVIFVTLEGPNGPDLWLVDVGFGGVNITQPIRIPRANEPVTTWSGTGPENYRISNGTLQCARVEPQRPRYMLENQSGVPHAVGESLKGEGVQNGTGLEWKVQYSFDLEEHFLHDMNALHWGTCLAPNGPQAFRVIAVKLEEVLPEAEDNDRDKFARLILADDTVKRRYQGKTVRLTKFTSEAERIAGHKTYFGIDIPEGESVIKTKLIYLS